MHFINRKKLHSFETRPYQLVLATEKALERIFNQCALAMLIEKDDEDKYVATATRTTSNPTIAQITKKELFLMTRDPLERIVIQAIYDQAQAEYAAFRTLKEPL